MMHRLSTSAASALSGPAMLFTRGLAPGLSPCLAPSAPRLAMRESRVLAAIDRAGSRRLLAHSPPRPSWPRSVSLVGFRQARAPAPDQGGNSSSSIALPQQPSRRGFATERDGKDTKTRPSQPSLPSSNSPSEPAPSSSTSSSSPLAKALAARENVYTIPNLLTASRLVAAPFLGYCIVHDLHAWTGALFVWAGVSDLLDGWIARRWGLGTVVGSVIDPMADKTLMLVLTVSLAVKGALPLWLVGIIIGRDVGLAIAAIYYRWISLPPPKTFMRYWDFSLPSAEVRPTTISKYNTFLQLALMGATIASPMVSVDVGGPLTIMQYVVAATTVWSGASYIFSKDAVRIISQAKAADKPKKLK